MYIPKAADVDAKFVSTLTLTIPQYEPPGLNEVNTNE